jgi:transposase
MLNIPPQDVVELKLIHKSLRDKRKADRIKLILYLNMGFSQIEVADMLLLDEDTITRWKQCFLNRKDNLSWIEDNYIPFWGNLSSFQIQYIRQYCTTFRVQTAQEIQSFISATMFVDYELSTIHKLAYRIGLSYKKLHRLPGKADVNKQAIFMQKYEQELEQMPENESIVFIDAVHPQHNSTPSNIWSIIGKERWIESNTGRERININGAYNPFTMDVITRQDTTINGLSTIELLKQVTAVYQDTKAKITVFSDNGRANKSVLVRGWLEKQSFIKMVYLPPYSPNLNLIERLWKFMRKKVINTKYYPELKDFKMAINSFFDNIEHYKEELKTFIGTRFQILNNHLTC